MCFVMEWCCFCGGVVVVLWPWFCDFDAVWLCFCGGAVVFRWWCAGAFVVVPQKL